MHSMSIPGSSPRMPHGSTKASVRERNSRIRRDAAPSGDNLEPVEVLHLGVGGDMYIEQFYLTCLAHASYMIGSDGVAAVVDPQRDVELYIDEARKNGLRIAHVIETHLHADFVSGHHELAERAGAQIYVGARAGATFPHVAVRESDEIKFGQCVLRILE